jgi:hypothetical protein
MVFADNAQGEVGTHNRHTEDELILLVLKWVSHVESLKIERSYVHIATKYSLYQGVTS